MCISLYIYIYIIQCIYILGYTQNIGFKMNTVAHYVCNMCLFFCSPLLSWPDLYRDSQFGQAAGGSAAARWSFQFVLHLLPAKAAAASRV